MTRALLLVVALGGAALLGCSPPNPGCCGHTTTIARMTDYVGTLAAVDGGAPTTVRVSVATNGNTTLTFERDGRTVVQSFTGMAK